ncbi:hypothetical protein DFJ58DRAFT_728296 [Suillus subalutaceus]|uniref:uncharacterized protein n=1 Tax=Suillus subalutaceus TaxID=48586 RepID=UPI001B873DF3|nr:uncharacterized protein DFJ58DRAFT_728296 [Suillus subalutaceus]KAG1853183.1 hypothetical protein DFJ58DRAFT_728296 [Suillus subalutaceus]
MSLQHSIVTKQSRSLSVSVLGVNALAILTFAQFVTPPTTFSTSDPFTIGLLPMSGHSLVTSSLFLVRTPRTKQPHWTESNLSSQRRFTPFSGLPRTPNNILTSAPLFTAFLEGALETLLRFCREFAPDGTIAQLSPRKRELARMNSTNDANEGALGTLRVSMWRAPRMSLTHFNARLKYKKNQTGTYVKTSLGPTARTYLRKRARINDTAGMERKRRIAQVEYDKYVVQRNREKDQKKKERREAAAAKLAAVVPRLTQEDINKMHVAELDLQIRWHRQFDSQMPTAKDLKGKKALEKRAILAAAAERLSSGEVGPNTNEAATMQEIEGHDTTNVGALLGDSDEENDL